MFSKTEAEGMERMEAPIMEPQRQFYYMDIAREYISRLEEEKGRVLTFHVTTFGCQMNARDSEKLRGILETVGYVESESEDAVSSSINTCTVQ